MNNIDHSFLKEDKFAEEFDLETLNRQLSVNYVLKYDANFVDDIVIDSE